MTKLSWSQSMRLLTPTIALTQKFLPLVFTELQGVGKGSGIPWRDLFVLNSFEALERFTHQGKCTSIIAKTRDRMLLAHNEDWVAHDVRWMYMLRARPKNEPAFLCVSYGCWLQTYGINDAGLAFVADSDHCRDARAGIAQTFIGREIMRYCTIAAATKRIITLPRADGHSYVFVDSRGGCAIVETTAKKHAILQIGRKFHSGNYGTFFAKGVLVHANFLQSAALQSSLVGPRSYSRFRHARVQELLASHRSVQSVANVSARQLLHVLADHQNYPESICNHKAENAQNQLDDQTIASFVLNPTPGTIHLIRGNPCRGQIARFTL